MSYRKVFVIAAAGFLLTAAASAGPSVEITSLAGSHSTAPQEWLQRLAEAGAGSTRIVSSGTAEPRLEELGKTASGAPLVKVYAVLTREGLLVLPGSNGAERFRPSDRAKLKEYFDRLTSRGAEAVTVPRGKYGLTEAEFTDLFTRLQAPMPKLPEGATLADAVNAAERAARVTIEIDAALRDVLRTKSEVAASVEGLSTGAALAAVLKQEGLALRPEAAALGEPPTSVGGVNNSRRTPPINIGGSPVALRVVASRDTKDAWPVGYDPEGTPTQTAPGLMAFLTIDIEGYTLAEALEALGPRIKWKDKPLPIVWDHFTLRLNAVDPATVEVRFPKKRTFYKSLLDNLASQARLKLDLRVDEAGTPFLWLTR
jgi:hypothetical protein